jgi:hypothetical protein
MRSTTLQEGLVTQTERIIDSDGKRLNSNGQPYVCQGTVAVGTVRHTNRQIVNIPARPVWQLLNCN